MRDVLIDQDLAADQDELLALEFSDLEITSGETVHGIRISEPNLCRGFKQFCETIEVRRTGIADHKVAQATLTRCFHIEREFVWRERSFVQPGGQRSFLENEHGDMVLSGVVNEVCAWRLLKIRHPVAQQRKFCILEFRKIEREGDFSLEPRLYRVPIGRDDIHRR